MSDKDNFKILNGNGRTLTAYPWLKYNQLNKMLFYLTFNWDK